MAENDAMGVSSGEDKEKVVPLCVRGIVSANLYSSCETHLSQERRFYCTFCTVALCQYCKRQHDCGHKVIQAYRFFKEVSFKMEDLKSLWDTSDIRPFKCRGLVAFIYKRGARVPPSQGESGVAVCESCQYQFRSAPGIKYCSVECKIEALMKMNEGGSTKSGAKRKVETISEENACNVQSSRKQPRK